MTDFPDRSKQRSNDGLMSAFSGTVKSALNIKDNITQAQRGTIGNVNYYTNLFENLGNTLIKGQNSKTAIEQSLFGIDYSVNKDTSFGFETKPIEGPEGLKRDYRFNLTKKLDW